MTTLDDDGCVRIAQAAQHLGACCNVFRNRERAGRVAEYRHPGTNMRCSTSETISCESYGQPQSFMETR